MPCWSARPNVPPCVIENSELKIVSTFEYLGRVLTRDSDDMVTLRDRISKGWASFTKKESILKTRHLPMIAKRKTYQTFVIPCVLYATETLAWNSKMIQMLQKFENNAMRWMANKPLISGTSIARLYEMCGLTNIVGLVKAKKASWYGHVKRSNLPVRVNIEGLIEGKRRRGRSKRRWRTDILECVKDRILWRKTCDALKFSTI